MVRLSFTTISRYHGRLTMPECGSIPLSGRMATIVKHELVCYDEEVARDRRRVLQSGTTSKDSGRRPTGSWEFTSKH